jgi:hypothetical protein
MSTLFRRFLVLAALLFWQGGFTFYSAVVVPVGQEVLGSHMEQGHITRHVTNYLNLSGAAALIVLAWDVAVVKDESRRRWIRWLAWVGMVVTLGLLVWLHLRLDDYLDADKFNRRAFRPEHRTYLWLSTIQWACGLVYLGLTLHVWRREDRGNQGE